MALITNRRRGQALLQFGKAFGYIPLPMLNEQPTLDEVTNQLTSVDEFSVQDMPVGPKRT